MIDDVSIRLGDRVQDEISNYQGIVIGIAEHLTGCESIAVRGDGEDPTRRSSEEWFYQSQLTVDDAQVLARGRAPSSDEIDVALGNRVVDEINGFEGIVTTINYNLDNVARAAVTATDDAEADRHWADVNRLTVLDDGVHEDFRDDMESDKQIETGAASMDGHAKVCDDPRR